MLVEQGVAPGWMVAAIVVREVLVTGLRRAAVERGVVLAAATSGSGRRGLRPSPPPWRALPRRARGLDRAAWWALLVAVVLTWLSGLDYARSAPALFSRAQPE